MKKFLWQVVPVIVAALAGCGGDGGGDGAQRVDSGGRERAGLARDAGPADHEEELPPPPPEGREVTAYRDGVAAAMRESEAAAAGLTVVDLSNYWVPFIFSDRDGADGAKVPNAFRPIFRKLANDWPYESRTMAEARRVVERRIERALAARMLELREQGMSEEKIREELGMGEEKEEGVDAGAKAAPGEDDEEDPLSGAGEEGHYLEVYGIPPSLSVLRKRALEEIGRPCFAQVDFEAIRRFDGVVAYRSNDVADEEAKKGRTFYNKMIEQMEKLGVEDPDALMAHEGNKLSAGLMRIALRYAALAEAQELLACEGLYAPGAERNYRKGGLDWKTHQALSAFERKNRIFAWGLFGEETLQALARTPEERLHDTLMRVVAERVADATGTIEDGTARDAEGNKAKYKDEAGAEREVPNLVAELSADLLRHMGLGTPAKVIEFLRAHEDAELDRLFVAVPLPPLPPYHSERMELFARIDRGDVWYEYPYTEDGRAKGQPRKQMPMTTLYTRWNGQEIPLVSMNTTIGSWRTELAPDGYEYYKYKNSDVGPRVWKDIVAGPVWLPPDTTPTTDMIKTVTYRGRKVKVPNYDEFGPWYASAYGLVAGFHYRQVERANGEFKYLDNGIRSHGSVDYNSILRRYSHGCHRLYNHLAIRLFDFVLRHREFTRVGEQAVGFSKAVEVDGEAFTITLSSRGYKYELAEPVPVEVLSGRIRGSQRSPIEIYMPKPEEEYGDDARFLPASYRRGAPDSDAGAPEAAVGGTAPAR